MTKVVMTLVVRNEEDILTANIEYHRSVGVDYFLVLNHLSTDKTSKILEYFTEIGVLSYWNETDAAYMQDKWVTELANRAVRDFHADWVINSDADEFWWPEIGNSIKNLLLEVPYAVDYLSVPRSNFLYHQQTRSNFIESMVYRDLRSTNSLGKPLPPKVMHRGYEGVRVAFGNHAVDIPGKFLQGGMIPAIIFHFPIRGREQYFKKIKDGGDALLKVPNLPSGVGATWRGLNERVKNETFDAWFDEMCKQNLNRVSELDGVVLDTRLREVAAQLQVDKISK